MLKTFVYRTVAPSAVQTVAICHLPCVPVGNQMRGVRHIMTSRLVFTARLRPQFRMPPVRGSVVRIRWMMRTQHFWIRASLSSTAAAWRHAASILPLHATIGGRLPEWQTSKCVSSVSFVRIESNYFIFYNTQETQTQKMMDQNFEIRILWFLRFFLKFWKRRCAVPLPPI